MRRARAGTARAITAGVRVRGGLPSKLAGLLAGLGAGVGLALVDVGRARAGGQLVGDNGAQGTQRAGAFAAKADDPTALWFNPAGFARAAPALYLGANLVDLDASYTRSGSYGVVSGTGGSQPGFVGDPFPTVLHQGGPQPVPMVAAGVRLGARAALGFGLMAPHGYGRRDYPDLVDTASGTDAPAPQRYDTVSQRAVVVLPSLALAADVGGGLALGARASLGYAATESRKFVQGIANNSEDPAQDSDVRLAAEDWGVPAFAVGLHYRASPTIELAAAWTSAITIEATGSSSTVFGAALREPAPGMVNYMEPLPDSEVRCATGGTRDALRACATVPAIPQTATAAIRYVVRDADGREQGDVELDVRWEDWSAASDYRVVVDGKNHLLGTTIADTVVRHGLQDVLSVRLGLAGVVEQGGRRWHLRGGLAYDSAAAPPSWTRLDLDGLGHATAAGGVGVELGRWRVDVGGALVLSARRNLGDVAIADPSDPAARVQPDIGVPLEDADHQPYNPFNAGAYRTGYWIASVGLLRRLGD